MSVSSRRNTHFRFSGPITFQSKTRFAEGMACKPNFQLHKIFERCANSSKAGWFFDLSKTRIIEGTVRCNKKQTWGPRVPSRGGFFINILMLGCSPRSHRTLDNEVCVCYWKMRSSTEHRYFSGTEERPHIFFWRAPRRHGVFLISKKAHYRRYGGRTVFCTKTWAHRTVDNSIFWNELSTVRRSGRTDGRTDAQNMSLEQHASTTQKSTFLLKFLQIWCQFDARSRP